MTIVKATLIALTALTAAGAAQAGPNLVPKFNVNSGVIGVANVGTDPAGRSIVTIGCAASGGGICPEPPAALLAPYQIAGYPNVAAVRANPIDAGKVFSHKISFYNSLVFVPGTYYFTVCADAGNHVAETNEGDNCKRFTKIVK